MTSRRSKRSDAQAPPKRSRIEAPDHPEAHIEAPKPSELRALNRPLTDMARDKVSLYLSPEVRRKLKHLAVNTGRDISDIANEAIEEFIEKHSKTGQ